MEVKKVKDAEALIENNKQISRDNEWYSSPEANQALMVAKRLRKTQHGMYASVPIICKGEGCPYAEACELQRMEIAPFGEKCPMEIAAIEDLFERYCTDMGIDPTDSNQQVDAIMVKEVVDLDIGMLRCDKKMAISADFIIEQIVSVTEEGNSISRQELHPLTEYKEKLRTQKYKTLNLLNSTRKDKEGNKLTIQVDPSQRAAEMMKINQDMEQIESEEDKAEKLYYEKMKRLKSGDSQIIDVEPIQIEEAE